MIEDDLFRWPDGALPPQPLNDQYTVTPPDPLIRTDFEEGDARQINAYSNAPGTFNVVWPMSPKQKFIFDGILANQLFQGTGWFAIPVFTHREYQLLKCRFVKGSIKPTRQGGEWLIAAQLETDDTQAPTELETLAAIVTFGSDVSFHDIVAELFQLVEFAYPGAMP